MPQRVIMRVIPLRHAQSESNRRNRFTGWADPVLTATAEAERAAGMLAARGTTLDAVYISRLRRGRDTADIVLDRIDQPDLPVQRDWRLNERHTGRCRASMSRPCWRASANGRCGAGEEATSNVRRC